MDILDDVKAIADQYDLEKPDQVIDNDWALASPETKSLLVQVEELKKPLADIYREAVSREDWRIAFFAFQNLIYIPFLIGIDPRVREAVFVARATEWIPRVKELLQWEHF